MVYCLCRRSTSYCLDVCSQGTKGGVSGTVEDLRPVSEVEAGVNFRLAGQVREQVVEQAPERRPGPGSRRSGGGAVTPSVHAEVLDTQFVSLGRGLGIMHSMGWKKVCGTARSGIWVLKGDARGRMLPADLEHLRVELRKAGVIRDSLGHTRARLSVLICVWPWSSSQTIN